MGLCLNRLMPRSTRWSSRGQVGSIVALFGLGHRRRAVRAPRFGIRPVRRRDHDGPPDRHDDGERIDRDDRAGASVCDDRAGAGGLNEIGKHFRQSRSLHRGHRPRFFLPRFDRLEIARHSCGDDWNQRAGSSCLHLCRTSDPTRSALVEFRGTANSLGRRRRPEGRSAAPAEHRNVLSRGTILRPERRVPLAVRPLVESDPRGRRTRP